MWTQPHNPLSSIILCMDIEQRVYTLEQDIKALYDRMGKVEDKAAGAWNTIREINGRMDKIEKRMETVEADVKQIKSEQGSMSKKLTAIMVILSVLGVICLGFFVYIWRHDTELAKSILTLGTTIGSIVA